MGIFAKNIKLSASNKIKHGHQNVLCDLNDVLISTRHEQSIFLLRIQHKFFPSPRRRNTQIFHSTYFATLFCFIPSPIVPEQVSLLNGLIIMSGKMPSNIIRSMQRMDNENVSCSEIHMFVLYRSNQITKNQISI